MQFILDAQLQVDQTYTQGKESRTPVILAVPGQSNIAVSERFVQFTGTLEEVTNFALFNQAKFTTLTITAAVDKRII